jgi:hypothetical protein
MINMNKGQRISLLGGLVLMIGAIMHWVKMQSSLTSITLSGYESVGLITGIMGFIILIASFINKGKLVKICLSAVIILSLASVFILINNMYNYVILGSTNYIHVSLGSGLFISIIGSILALFGGLINIPEVFGKYYKVNN